MDYIDTHIKKMARKYSRHNVHLEHEDLVQGARELRMSIEKDGVTDVKYIVEAIKNYFLDLVDHDTVVRQVCVQLEEGMEAPVPDVGLTEDAMIALIDSEKGGSGYDD